MQDERMQTVGESFEEEQYKIQHSAAAPTTVTQVTNKDEERQRKWYAAGVKAKKNSYGDLSPFYENATADYFFKCGYDNVPFVEAQQVLKDKIQQIMESNPLITEVTNEYASKQIQK